MLFWSWKIVAVPSVFVCPLYSEGVDHEPKIIIYVVFLTAAVFL